MVKITLEKGYYLFKLDDILEQNNMSINQIARDIETDFRVIKRLITGDLIELDMIILAKLCNYFQCNLTDIIEYVNKS